MLKMGIRMTQQSFFSTAKIQRALDRATRRALSKFGAYVRRSARSSIRKRKRSALPGKPPSSHSGLLRRFIYFAYDMSHESVVIGPVLLHGSLRGGISPKAGTTVPELLEYGGLAESRGRPVHYSAHPYMGPAFEKEIPKFPSLWRDSVK